MHMINNLTGCIKDLKIGRQSILIHSKHDPNIVSSNMLVDCIDNPCSAMPCENQGSCQAAISNSYASISKNLARYLRVHLPNINEIFSFVRIDFTTN